MEYLLGIDIGGTHVKGGIVTGTTGKMDQRTIVYEKIGIRTENEREND